MTLEQDYRNQDVLKVLKNFGEWEEIPNFDYCKLYEQLESYLL